MSQRNRRLLAIAGIGLCLRLLAAFVWFPDESQSDEVLYQRLAAAIYHEQAYALEGTPTAIRTPGYPLFLAATYAVAGDSVTASLISQIILSIWTILLVAGIARRLGMNEACQLLTAGLAACYPFFVYYSALLLTETMTVWALSLCYWLFLRWQAEPRMGWAALWGLSAGVLALTRPSFLLWALLLVLVELIRNSRLSAVSCRTTGLALLAFLLLPAAWGWRNHRALGHATLDTHAGATCMECMVFYEINKAGRFAQTFNSLPLALQVKGMTEWEKDQFFQGIYQRFFREHPRRFFIQALKNVKDLWRFYPRRDISFGHSPWVLSLISLLTELPLIVLGLYGFWRSRRQWVRWYPIWIAAMTLTLVHALSCAQMRYRLPLMPFFMVGAVYGWSAISSVRAKNLS